MGKIEKELGISKKYLLETEDFNINGKHKKLVKLSLENVGKVEAMIHTDDRY